MSARTGIEWTDATWNPVTGCTKVSPGCDHCYAETIAHRFAGTKAYPFGFAVTLQPERLGQPFRWRKPRRIFVNSMSDLFHDDIPDDYIAQVFSVMAQTQRHTYQILTKRPARMRSLLSRPEFIWPRVWGPISPDMPDIAYRTWPLPNVWLGVSTENQQWADIRIPTLLDTPAAVRFISAEPLLGPISLIRWLNGGFGNVSPDLHWVIVGGESGAGARMMSPDWARDLRDECVAADVPLLFKQWGAWGPINDKDTMQRLGKHAAGRELDGHTWDQYPVLETV